MITPSGKDYKRAVRIKDGRSKINVKFRSLAGIISQHFRVAVLDLFLDYVVVARVKKPRINVVIERKSDYSKIEKSALTADRSKVKWVESKFIEIVGVNEIENAGALFAIFTCFETVNNWDVIEKIKTEQLASIVEDEKDSDLWMIDNHFTGFTVFFKTISDASEHKNKILKERISERIYEIIKSEDKYGYISRENMPVVFDSKERFEAEYNGNWFYYYK